MWSMWLKSQHKLPVHWEMKNVGRWKHHICVERWEDCNLPQINTWNKQMPYFHPVFYILSSQVRLGFNTVISVAWETWIFDVFLWSVLLPLYLFNSHNQSRPRFNKTCTAFNLLSLFHSHRQKITRWVYRCSNSGIAIYNSYAATCRNDCCLMDLLSLWIVPITLRQIKQPGFQRALMHIN